MSALASSVKFAFTGYYQNCVVCHWRWLCQFKRLECLLQCLISVRVFKTSEYFQCCLARLWLCLSNKFYAYQPVYKMIGTSIECVIPLRHNVWRKFAKWLRSPNATIMELTVCGCMINAKDKIKILISLKTKKFITKLIFELMGEIKSGLWNGLSHLLCGKQALTIHTCQNHALASCGWLVHWW